MQFAQGSKSRVDAGSSLLWCCSNVHPYLLETLFFKDSFQSEYFHFRPNHQKHRTASLIQSRSSGARIHRQQYNIGFIPRRSGYSSFESFVQINDISSCFHYTSHISDYLACTARASNSRAIVVSRNAGDLENSVEHTSDPLSSDQTSSDGVAEDLVVLCVLLLP